MSRGEGDGVVGGKGRRVDGGKGDGVNAGEGDSVARGEGEGVADEVVGVDGVSKSEDVLVGGRDGRSTKSMPNLRQINARWIYGHGGK